MKDKKKLSLEQQGEGIQRLLFYRAKIEQSSPEIKEQIAQKQHLYWENRR
mgnify:CR=1 FL=1